MSNTHYIALDTHREFCEMVALSQAGRKVRRDRCPTSIPHVTAMIEQVPGPRILTFEEGPLADWLARNLRPAVDELIVCEPRRNALIAKEGDKDDPIDAEKLAQLLRGGYLKEVHQVHSLDRALLKQHVSFYHDRVRERVRQGNQLTGLLARQGVFASIGEVFDPDQRRRLWKQLPPRKVLREDLQAVLRVYEMLVEQEARLQATLIRLARREEPVRRFEELPGFGWIRSVTFYAYIDTPHRFARKTALWKYCALGLERRHSGGGPTRVKLAKHGQRRLKCALLGAALTAIGQGNNPFAEKYVHWTQEEGLHPATARRNVARAMVATLWSMWKTGSRYDPARVRGVGRASSIE